MKTVRQIRDFIKQFELPLYFVTAILGLFLAAGAIFRAAKYPSESVWLPGKPLFAALVVSAVWVPIYTLYKAIDSHLETRDKQQTSAERDLAVACQKVVSRIADACPTVGVNDLAASVSLCGDDGSFKVLARFYLPHDLKASGVGWRKGKGVAGTAWAAGEDLSTDLTVFHARLKELGKAGFDALPSGERLGLSASDLEGTKSETGVCAIRLQVNPDAPKLAGMFVLVYSGTEGFDCISERIGKREVSQVLAGCEKVLEEAGGAL